LDKDQKFQTFSARKENEDKLDQFIEEWTRRLSAEEVMRWMQEAGFLQGRPKQ